MNIQKHGLSIGIERTGNTFFLALKIQGKLSHEDYKTITPMLDAALAEVKSPKVKAIIDLTELEGWEARAAWDDLKLGLKHGNEFERIAIIGNKKWQELSAKVGSWFIAGEIQYFTDSAEATGWLNN